MKEWPINTPIGEMTVYLDFFTKISIKEIRPVCETLFIHLNDGHSFSINEKDWIQIKNEIRDLKINKIINEEN